MQGYEVASNLSSLSDEEIGGRNSSSESCDVTEDFRISSSRSGFTKSSISKMLRNKKLKNTSEIGHHRINSNESLQKVKARL